jgi:16S rRNA (guanine527-N7)-methyltransferase
VKQPHEQRLHELCTAAGLPLSTERQLAVLLELLTDDPEAPTSITSPIEAVDVHIADSLSSLPLVAELAASEPVIDIGSGAGFPGLPIAAGYPGGDVDLLEATTRKCRFIARAIERLDLRNAEVVCARAEEWGRSGGAGRYAVALARAVAPLPTLVEYASPLLREGGVLVAWKGARDEAEEDAGAAAARRLGMSPREVRQVSPFPAARHRHLHLFGKTAPTPTGIPRRPGMARKRPFGDESSTPN